ncbi:MAG: hypothetical protein ACYDEK_11135 [Vulcanimicrobiaceae bacterium]
MNVLRFACFAMVVLFAGCESTWATPNQVNLKPVGGSRITGIADVTLSLVRLHSNLPVGSDLEVQFQDLHNPKPYIVTLQSGSCASGAAGRPVARFTLIALSNPSEGLEGGAHVDIPIEKLMKAGYYIALIDLRLNRIVSCGDLRTDRFF